MYNQTIFNGISASYNNYCKILVSIMVTVIYSSSDITAAKCQSAGVGIASVE